MANTILVIGGFDCNDRVHTFLESFNLGVATAEWTDYGGLGIDIAVQGPADESALVTSEARVRIHGDSQQDLIERINALRAELRVVDNTVTYGVPGAPATCLLKLKRSPRIAPAVDVLFTSANIAIVELQLVREPWVYGATETLYSAANITIPCVVDLSAMHGDAAAPPETTLAFAALECDALYVGHYPDATVTIATFMRELVDATWTNVSGTGAAAADPAGYPDGVGNTVWSTEGQCYTDIDVSDFEPGSYLVMAKAKTADTSDPGTLQQEYGDAVTLTTTGLHWYELGIVSLPCEAVRGAATSTLRLTLTGAGAEDGASVNAVCFVPVSFGGLIRWVPSSGHAHTIVASDGMLYADDVATPGFCELRALGGVLVVLACVVTPAATTAAKTTISYTSRWEQIPSSGYPTKIAFIGDSITSGITPTYPHLRFAAGYDVRTMLRLRQRLDLVAYAGHGGKTFVDLLSYVDTEIIPYSPDICVVQGGTNDIGQGRTAEQVEAAAAALHAHLHAAGIKTVACDTTTSASWTSAQLDIADAYNTWLAGYAAATEGVIAHAAWNDDFADVDRYPVESYVSDGTHPTADGAAVLGYVLAAELKAYADIIPEKWLLPNEPGTQLVANPYMTGNVAGVATGWELYPPAGGACTGTKVARTDGVSGEWQQVEVTSNPDHLGIRFQRPIETGFSEGDVVRAAIEFEVDPGATWNGGLYACLRDISTGTFVADNYETSAEANMTLPPADGVLLTPEYTIPAGTVKIQPELWAFCDLGIFRVGRVCVWKVR